MTRTSGTRRAGVGLLAGLVALIVGCDGERAGTDSGALGEPAAGGLGVACYQTGVDDLNPFTSPTQVAGDLRLVLFTPLVLYGDPGEYRPHLAREWESADQGRQLTLRIREDMTWHDGTRLTARDVAWTLTVAANPDYTYMAGDFASLEKARAIDSVTVELVFAEPFIADMEPFVGLPILPRHLLADLSVQEFATADYHREPVGSGPFRFVERRPDGSLVLERNPNYPDALGPVYLERLVVRSIPEGAAVMAELESGAVDICAVAEASVAERARASARLEVRALEPARTAVIPLNTEREPLDDPRVRRALSAALDRDEIAAAASPVARPAQGPLGRMSPAFAADIAQPDDDPVLADSLLRSAGWTRSDGVRTNAEGERLDFAIVAPQGMEDILTLVQAHFRQVGVEVQLQFMEWASYVSLLQNPDRRPPAMALAFAPEKIYTPDSELYAQFHSSGFSNLGSYSNAEVDSLLETLQGPLSPEARDSVYRAIQRRAAVDVPTLYTISMPRMLIQGPRVQGVELDLNGPFTSVAEWWIPPERRRR